MKLFLGFLILLLCNGTGIHAQSNSITGTVMKAEGNTALANCNVFISNSSKGTITDSAGRFTLYNVPEGNSLDLLVSNAGYETHTYTFASKNLPLNLTIKLNRKIVNLGNVIIRVADPNGWDNWGTDFIKNFIGESENASSCKIENPEAVKFYYNKKENILEVSADSILIIKNYRLGYRIKYQLENFVYNMNAQTIRYAGYPLFEELEPDVVFRDKYIPRRAKTYKGSMLHFMRSLYTGQLSEQGYKVINSEPEPGFSTLGNDGRAIQIDLGSSEPKKNKRSHDVNDEQQEKKVKKILTRNDLLFKGNDSVRNVLSFDNYLSITLFKPEEEAYNMFPGFEQKSKLFILNDDKKIIVEPNGHYYPVLDLLIEGYMAWEKIGDQLPFDYMPPPAKSKKRRQFKKAE